MALHFRAGWSGSLISLALPSPHNFSTIYDIKKKLTEIYGFRCDFLHFLLPNGRVCSNTEPIDVLISDETIKIIDLQYLPPQEPPVKYQSYDPYIQSIQYQTLSGEPVTDQTFPQNGNIDIIFCEDSQGNYLELDQILSDNKFSRSAETNMIEIFGIVGAQERGFVQWTNHIINEYIVLLDLGSDSTELKKKIDQIRYKWDGINSLYWAGDSHSWQRYSKKIPITIDLSLTSFSAPHSVSKKKKLTISPKVSLTAGGCYAVVLLHDIPLHSTSPPALVLPSAAPFPRGVAEDKVIFFRVHNPEKKKLHTKSSAQPAIPSSTPHPELQSSLPSFHSNEVYLSVKTYHSSHSPHEYHMIIKPATTVLEIKSFLSAEFSIPLSHLIVSLNGTLLLNDSEKLINCGLEIRNMVRILPSFGLPSHSLSHPNYSLETSNLLSSYAPYVSSVSPAQYEKNVSLTTAITIRFQSVFHIARSGQYHNLLEQKKKVLNNSLSLLPATQQQRLTENYSDQRYVSRSLVLSCFHSIASPWKTSSAAASAVSLQCPDMRTLLGEEEAKNCGSICWLTDSDTFETLSTQKAHQESSSTSSPTAPAAAPQPTTHRTSFSSNQRFYLLELDSLEQIERDWKTLRYRYAPWEQGQGEGQGKGEQRGRNGFYCGGDRYSWQRYTRYLPVMGSFVINSDQQTLTFKPFLPLYPGTTYGILLANGVPSIPSSASASAGVSSVDWYSIQEDLLFVFTTEGRQGQGTGQGQAGEVSHEERMKWNRHDIQLQRSLAEEQARQRTQKSENSGEEGCLLS